MALKFSFVLLFYLFDLIYCATINDISLMEETFIIRYFEERKIIPVKVDLDFKNQTEIVQILSNNNSWISISFHDFIEETKAYKDYNGSQCFISRASSETIEDDRKKLKQLNNGIVKGSYIPTFYILKEIDHKTNISQKFGKRIAQFCDGSSVSLVSKDGNLLNRKKRQTVSDRDKGQFTHHSYGHYGHQSNNYAHYGHDTRITGNIDKDGNIRDQTMTQYQERSQSSQSYPLRSSGTLPDTAITNERKKFSTSIPNQNAYGGDSQGQYSLQTAHESGYQLNLPFGLKAGNVYRDGISSSGQYGASRGMPYDVKEQNRGIIGSGLQRYPSSSIPSFSQASYPSTYSIPKSPGHLQSGSSHLSPPLSGIDHRTVSRDMPMQYGHRADETKSTYPSLQHQQPGQLTSYHRSVPRLSPQSHIKTITTDSESKNQPSMPNQEYKQSVLQPDMMYQPSVQTAPIVNGRQSGISSHWTGNGRYSIKPNSAHELRSSDHQPSSIGQQIRTPTHSGIPYQPQSLHDATIARYQPSSSGRAVVPEIQPVRDYKPSSLPGTLITADQPIVSGYQPNSLSGIVTKEGLPAISGYKPGSPQSQITGQITPSTSAAHLPGSLPLSPSSGYGPGHLGGTLNQHMPQAFNGGSIPRHLIPKEGDLSAPTYETQRTQISQPRYSDSHLLTEQRQISVPRVDQQLPGDISRFSPGIPTQSRTLDSVQSQSSGIPRDRIQGGQTLSRDFPSQTSSVRGTGEYGYYSRPQTEDRFPDASVGGVPGGSRAGQYEPGRIASVGRDAISERGIGDSASSQTQVQTGAEGTAAEASSAGQYRGIGSKTQVQGGYAGNGSFSAQAQSGFSGGITQSQVQGGKQGGLSGSSAIVENFGSAQSQVQIGRPSGSASSTALGQFSQGMTSVRAQSGRTGGSAGAESQSRGLSSSQVQVDIAGQEVTGDDDFQGTVSASVLGSSLSGQSQTQLQGGYKAGRTYAATAQGGFDASIDYQGSVPILGTNPLHAGQVLDRNANVQQSSQLPTSGTLDQSSVNDKTLSPKTDVLDEKYINQGNYHQIPRISYPSQSLDHYPTSHIVRNQPGANLSPHMTPLTDGTTQTDLSGRPLPFDQQHSTIPGSQPSMIYPHSRRFYETPSSVQSPPQVSNNDRQPPHLAITSQQPGYHSLQQSLPRLSQPTQSFGPERRVDILQPSSHIQEGSQPSSPAIKTQNGFITPDSPTQFDKPLDYVPPYSPAAQNGDLSKISSKRDNFVPSSIHSLDGGHLTSQPQPHFIPGQYQPSLQGSSPSSGYATAPKLQPPTSTGISTSNPSSIGSLDGGHLNSQPQPHFIPGQYQPSLQGPSTSNGYATTPKLQLPTSTGINGVPPASYQPFRPPGSTFPLVPNQGTHLIPGSSTSQPIAPQPSTLDRDIPVPQRPSQSPGVREPSSSDVGSCCDALRNLKNRCCGRTTQKQNGSCCLSIRDDLMEDFDDEDLSSNKEPCKVVKAICYIVYKPVGKARICKPTSTNSC